MKGASPFSDIKIDESS